MPRRASVRGDRKENTVSNYNKKDSLIGSTAVVLPADPMRESVLVKSADKITERLFPCKTF